MQVARLETGAFGCAVVQSLRTRAAELVRGLRDFQRSTHCSGRVAAAEIKLGRHAAGIGRRQPQRANAQGGNMSALRTALLLVLTGAAAPVLAEQITCESQQERNQICTTLQAGSSVQMVQQLSRAPCIEGQTWGADEGHIWVSAGCRATFDVR